MRKFFLEDPLHPNGGISINCKDDRDCVFCKHCYSTFWDYTNYIYMIICDEGHDPWERPCPHFVEEEADEKAETKPEQETVN